MMEEGELRAERLTMVVSRRQEDEAYARGAVDSSLTLRADLSWRPKARRVTSALPTDVEELRSKYELIRGAWAFVKLKQPGAAIVADLAETTWDSHLKWLLSDRVFYHSVKVGPLSSGRPPGPSYSTTSGKYGVRQRAM